MRSSGTLINLAAAAALAFAAGSLWHAYKVRFGDETEHAASAESVPAEPSAAPAGVEPEQQAEAGASVPPPVPSSATDSDAPATTPAAREAAPEAVVPAAPAPVALAPVIETAKAASTPTPSPARVSLRDPREIPAAVPAATAETPARSTPPALAAGARAGDRPAPVLPALSDRRSLTERSPATSPVRAGDTANRPTASALRDARQIVALQMPAMRSAGGSAPEPVAPQAPALSEAQSTTAISTAPSPVAPCGPHRIATEARDGGMMRVEITSACRINQDVQLAYGGVVQVRRLDRAGRLDFLLDCFAGATNELLVTFADGQQEQRPVVAKDLEKLSKVAVIWSAPVNLDLHAFEYSAGFGKAGHVWERAASTLVSAREIAAGGRRGRGFLSTSDDGRSLGDKLEVYTFLHHDEQASGVVAMGLDYETRGENPAGMTCGNGAFAEVRYQVATLGRRGQTGRETGILLSAPCGTKIGSQARFDPFLLPAVRVQK